MAILEQLSPDARRVLIGVNPHAGARSRRPLIEELCSKLKQVGLNPEVVEDVDRLAGQAAECLEKGELRAVIAAGGDGTIRLMADRTPVGTPLLVFPLGTENLLGGYLEMTAEPWQSARAIAEGFVVGHDAGEANGRLFILVAGCGFDADVVRRLHRHRKGHIHHLSYAKPILDAIRKYDYPELRVYCAPADGEGGDGELTHEIAARWAFVVNLPRYAGGLSFAPDASGSDGLLDVCTFKEGSLWYGLVYLGGVLLGQHEGMQDFVRIQTKRLRIESTAKVPFQLDGDPGGDVPVDIRVMPNRLKLVVTRAWATRQGWLAADETAGGDS